MYVILTSKTGEYRTEAVDGIVPVAAFDFYFYGVKRAHYVIARLERETKVRLVEDAPPHIVNVVPTKFLEKFGSIGDAEGELKHLTKFGSMDTRLDRVDIAMAGGRG